MDFQLDTAATDFSAAVGALFKKQKASGEFFCQPSEVESFLEDGVWHLRNINGLLGKVSYDTCEVL